MGYGYYKWTDERMYEGYWFKGKQHGLGVYSDPKKGIRYGLWEHGKRIKWYNEQEIEQINSGQYDYTCDLVSDEAARFCDPGQLFERPEGIDEAIYELKMQFKI